MQFAGAPSTMRVRFPGLDTKPSPLDMICVSLGRTRHQKMIDEQAALAKSGAELIELRLDFLSRPPDVSGLLKNRPVPVVVTCRRRQDRGLWRWDEATRQTVLRTAIVCEADYVDLEDDIAGSIPRFGKTRRIVSHHDFAETPTNLAELHAEMKKLDPDIIKLVTMANSADDAVRLLEITAASDVPTIGFCMGDLGLFSRILCGKYGAPFSYATFSADRVMAPGQLAFQEMRSLYQFDRIGPETKVFGVVGDPIGHSLSPLLHNRAFQHHGMDCVYIPFRIPRNHLSETLNAMDWLGIRGYSVTIPHKQDAMEYADVCDESVKRIGAANTLFRGDDNLWHAGNTDCEAAIQSLRTGLAEGQSLEGKRAIVLGAGGAARAIVEGLTRAGAFVVIANRSNSRSEKLAHEFGCSHTRWEHRGREIAEILINCTPVGMSPQMDETPFPDNWLTPGMLVFDTVYNPENTLLIKQARSRGCRTISGIEMFIRQAAAQFERFTGECPDLELLRNTLRRKISAVNYED
jgi:3-dehydroquinate dehydratase / shikimate dehydrogenase